MVVIVDYGMGNLGSIVNMLKKIGIEAFVSSDASTIYKAEKLILPGVGAFDNGMFQLNKLGLIEALNTKVYENRTPIMGICLGMQLMTKKSDEGYESGLGYIDAQVNKFKFNEQQNELKIPHMGWNTINIINQCKLFKDMPVDSRFYFVHSYYVNCHKSENILAITHYGKDFTSAFQKNNIVGVQFHPEKSHKFGMILLKNFLEYY